MNNKKGGLKEKAADAITRINSHHTGAYAAQAAYFFVLSMIPIIMLLITAIQFTPVTKENLIEAVAVVFPTSVEGLIEMIVNEVYSQSGTIIPLTLIAALWSAGKGTLSMASGLNCTFECKETRNYLLLRLRASLYIVIFIIAIVLSLVLSVFGNKLAAMLTVHFPLLERVMNFIIEIRTIFNLAALTLIWELVYKFLPNWKSIGKTTLWQQLPGAFFSAFGWQVISFIFSIYLDIFTGFSTMYGSMTTIILIMLWLYMCMYMILLGGELNAFLIREGYMKEPYRRRKAGTMPGAQGAEKTEKVEKTDRGE